MRRVIIESPFAGATIALAVRNVRYVRLCLRDALLRDEAPFASHALYTLPGVLRDEIPEERKLGMHAGLEWAAGPYDLGIAAYTDLGISPGMEYGFARHRAWSQTIEERSLGDAWAGVAEELRLMELSYDHVIYRAGYKPHRAAFRRMAIDRGWSEADFDDWARGREWQEHV